MLLSDAINNYEADKRIEGFSYQTLKAYRLQTKLLIDYFTDFESKEEFIVQNPSRKIKEPKVGKRIPKFLTEREIEYLRNACITPMENSLFEFMFSTGCIT